MESKNLISVVVPMYYEEQVANECYRRLKDVMTNAGLNYEFIFVNDGSQDGTIDILKEIAKNDKKVKIIDFARNFGHQIAVTAGVFNSKGDAVVIIDADLQDPPELIVEMVAKWKQGFNVVYAKRKKRNGETRFKLFTAKCFYKFLSCMSDVDIPRDTGDFRIMDKKVVEVFKSMPERNRFVRGMVSWLGFKQTYIEYERDERFAGVTKYPLKKMLKLASDGIIGFSCKPLRFVTKLGFTTTILALLTLFYALIKNILGNAVSNWTFIMLGMIFFSGIQLLAIGVLGEYIGRIYDESKNRPLFTIRDMINFEEEKKVWKGIKQIS